MEFNRHTNLKNLHAPFSASSSAWLRYDDERAVEVYRNLQAAAMGTRLHAWAKETIDLGIKQPKSKKTISAYVNDAIGYKMSTEVILYYSDRFFGTADAISFRDKTLRIHDLKTGHVGKIESHIDQLRVYAALFCLEYRIKPRDISIELRIYKNDEVVCDRPEPEIIEDIIETIIHFDKLLERLETEEG